MKELTLDELARLSRSEAEAAIRARVHTVYLGRDVALTRILGRHKLYLATDDVGFAGHVMLDGFWEMWLTQFFARRIKPGMTVVDVGAHFGYYTLLFGDLVGPDGRVLAIEPAPATARLLERSIALNGYSPNVRLECLAVGRIPDGLGHLFVPPGETKNAALGPSGREGSIEVVVTTLDHLIRDYDRIDLVKIDAEGSEIDIITGMADVITRHAPDVLLEYNAARYTDPQGFLDELMGSFASITVLDPDGALRPASAAEIATPHADRDWLLFLEGKR